MADIFFSNVQAALKGGELAVWRCLKLPEGKQVRRGYLSRSLAEFSLRPDGKVLLGINFGRGSPTTANNYLLLVPGDIGGQEIYIYHPNGKRAERSAMNTVKKALSIVEDGVLETHR